MSCCASASQYLHRSVTNTTCLPHSCHACDLAALHTHLIMQWEVLCGVSLGGTRGRDIASSLSNLVPSGSQVKVNSACSAVLQGLLWMKDRNVTALTVTSAVGGEAHHAWQAVRQSRTSAGWQQSYTQCRATSVSLNLFPIQISIYSCMCLICLNFQKMLSFPGFWCFWSLAVVFSPFLPLAVLTLLWMLSHPDVSAPWAASEDVCCGSKWSPAQRVSKVRWWYYT